MPSSVDREWFLSVLDSHQRLIYQVCWAYANSPDERDDLFQEIAVRLLSAARNYNSTRKLSTWIYRALLLLHLEGNTHREIGEVLGFSESNVGTQLIASLSFSSASAVRNRYTQQHVRCDSLARRGRGR